LNGPNRFFYLNFSLEHQIVRGCWVAYYTKLVPAYSNSLLVARIQSKKTSSLSLAIAKFSNIAPEDKWVFTFVVPDDVETLMRNCP
jgi:hypothetical protein